MGQENMWWIDMKLVDKILCIGSRSRWFEGSNIHLSAQGSY